MAVRAVLVLVAVQLAPSLDALAQDSTRSPLRIDSAALRLLPIDEPRHTLSLVPGVRMGAQDLGVTWSTLFLIRGSATAQGNVYVDGAPVGFRARGVGGVDLAPNAIAGLSVLTGVAPATLADVGGGAIAYRSRTGGERLAGGLRWDTEEPFSERASVGYNRIEGALGGPLAASGRLSFFASATLQGQQSTYRGGDAADVPAFLPGGPDTTVDNGGPLVDLALLDDEARGLQRPLDWIGARRGLATLSYRYGDSARVTVTLLGGDVQQRLFPANLALVPALYTGRRLWSGAAIANVQHPLGAWAGGPLTLDLNFSLVSHHAVSGPLDSAIETATQDPALGITFRRLRFAGADVLGLPTDDALVRDLRTNSGTRGVPFFGALPEAAQGFRTNPYGVATGWPTSGYGGTLSDLAERRVQGRASVEWNRRASQRLSAGVDFERGRVSAYTSDIIRMIGTDAFTAQPSRIGVFTENRFQIQDAVIEVGLRYDRIDPGGVLPIVPSFISSSGPALWNPNAATDDTAYANSVARVFRPAATKSALSPRLRLTYPLAAGATVRLGYSRVLEPPAWRTFFTHSNNDLSFTNVSDLFGRDVDFAMTGLIEAGARLVRGPAVVDVSLYRKDLARYVGRLRPFPRPTDTTSIVSVNVLTQAANVPVQGIDIGVDWRRGWVGASVAYSLAHVGSSPGSLTVSPVADVTAHGGALALFVAPPRDWHGTTAAERLARGASIGMVLRAQNGQTFAVQPTSGFGTLTPDESLILTLPTVAHLPWFKRLDLRISKTMRAGGRAWSLYVDGRNLLNFSNLLAEFAETADTVNTLYKLSVIGDTSATGTGEYRALWLEAQDASALDANRTVDLRSCATWSSPVNCVALTRVERRFGDGDGLYTVAEQQQTFESYYRDLVGTWRFFGPKRTIRVGLTLSL